MKETVKAWAVIAIFLLGMLAFVRLSAAHPLDPEPHFRWHHDPECPICADYLKSL